MLDSIIRAQRLQAQAFECMELATTADDPRLKTSYEAIAKRYLELADDELESDPARIGPVIDPLENARAAILMIREVVEALAPPGALPQRAHTGVNMTEEAEVLIRAIRIIAGAGDIPE